VDAVVHVYPEFDSVTAANRLHLGRGRLRHRDPAAGKRGQRGLELNGIFSLQHNMTVTYGDSGMTDPAYEPFWTSPRFEPDRSYTFMIHKKYSKTNTGFVEIYLDGVHQQLCPNAACLIEGVAGHGANHPPGRDHLQVAHGHVLQRHHGRDATQAPGHLPRRLDGVRQRPTPWFTAAGAYFGPGADPVALAVGADPEVQPRLRDRRPLALGGLASGHAEPRIRGHVVTHT
jgi:hypothetical protein